MPKPAIVCVDDEKIILTSLRDQIKGTFGNCYMVELAESPSEALEVIEELEEDNVEIILIISDWLMPEMKGDDFLILVHRSLPKTAKIMLTGQADHKAIERAKREANLYRHLPKPWSEGELIEAIRSGSVAIQARSKPS